MKVEGFTRVIERLGVVADHAAELQDTNIPRLFGKDEARTAALQRMSQAASDAEEAARLVRDFDPATSSLEHITRAVALLRETPAETDAIHTAGATLQEAVEAVRADVGDHHPDAEALSDIFRIASKRDRDVEMADLERMAEIEQLPDAVRPRIPSTSYSWSSLHENEWLPDDDSDARAAMTALRSWAERERIVGDPTKDSAWVANEMTSLLSQGKVEGHHVQRMRTLRDLPAELQPADSGDMRKKIFETVQQVTSKPTGNISMSDMRRMSLVEELPSALKHDMPESTYLWSSLVESEWLPKDDSDARNTLHAWRSWSERERVVGDPTFTKERVLGEVESLLTGSSVKDTHIARMAAVRDLPAELQPVATDGFRRTVLDTVSAVTSKSDEDVTMSDMRRLTLIEELPPALKPNAPSSSYSWSSLVENDWLPKDDSDARNTLNAWRHWIERERFIGDPTMSKERVLDEIAALLTAPEVSEAQLSRMTVIRDLPAELQPEANPALRARVREAIEAVTAKSTDDVSMSDMRRMALVEELPAALQADTPDASYSWSSLVANEWLPGDDGDARATFTAWRTWVEREKIVGDPTMTRTRVLDAVSEVVSKRDRDITREDMQRLATLEDLPESFLVNAPQPTHSWASLVGNDWLPKDDSDARNTLRAWRAWAERERIVGDPSMTKDRVLETVTGLLSKPDVDGTDVARASVLAELPADLQPTATDEFRRSLWDAVESVTSKSDDDVTMSDMRRMAMIETLPETLNPKKPSATYSWSSLVENEWLPDDDGDARNTIRAWRTWIERERIVGDPSMTRERVLGEVEQMLAADRVTEAQVARMEIINELPEALQPQSSTEFTQRIRDLVGGITSKSDSDITISDMQRMTLIEKLPPNLIADRPNSTYRWAALVENDWLPKDDSDARNTLRAWRTWIDRERYVGDPTMTKERVAQEIAELLATQEPNEATMTRLAVIGGLPESLQPSSSDELRTAVNAVVDSVVSKRERDISANDMRRMALVEALPESIVASKPDSTYSWSSLVENDWMPKDDGDAQNTLRAWTQWSIRERYVGDATTTAEQVATDVEALIERDELSARDLAILAAIKELPAELQPTPSAATKQRLMSEVVALSMKRDRNISMSDMRRLALIEQLPGNYLPGFPHASYSWKSLVANEWLPKDDGDAQRTMGELRLFVSLTTDEGKAMIREKIRGGGELAPEISTAITRGGHALLEEIGITEAELLPTYLKLMDNAGDRSISEATETMQAFRAIVDGMPVDASLQDSKAQIIELLDRNITRGERGSYIDYAEMGEARIQTEMLLMLQESTPAPSVPTTAVEDAVEGAEKVTW